MILTSERVEKPWGWEERIVTTDRYTGKMIHVRGRHATSKQVHQKKDETLCVVSGLVIVQTWESWRRHGTAWEADKERKPCKLSPHDAVRFAPGTVHRIVAVYDSVIAEFSTPHDDDDIARFPVAGRELGGPVGDEDFNRLLEAVKG